MSSFLGCANYSQMAKLIEKISRPQYQRMKDVILSTVHGSKDWSQTTIVSGVADGLFPLASGDQEEEPIVLRCSDKSQDKPLGNWM